MRFFFGLFAEGGPATGFGIRPSIWLGFALLLTIPLLFSLAAMTVFAELKQGIHAITEKLQPVVMTTQGLQTELESASGALGYYLLTRESTYRDGFERHLANARSLADRLQALTASGNSWPTSGTEGSNFYPLLRVRSVSIG